jgi:hypothetical protein
MWQFSQRVVFEELYYLPLLLGVLRFGLNRFYCDLVKQGVGTEAAIWLLHITEGSYHV